jgi:hypothetical protein
MADEVQASVTKSAPPGWVVVLGVALNLALIGLIVAVIWRG